MPTKKPNKNKPTTAKPRKQPAAKSQRKVERPTYRSFKLSKRLKHHGQKPPNSFQLLNRAIRHLLVHKKVFGGILGIYLLLIFVLVKSFTFGSGLTELDFRLEGIASRTDPLIAGSIEVFNLLLESSSQTTASADAGASAYQMILVIIMSLVIIWALRQTYAKKKITIKEAFYKSMYPFIPFVLVLLAIVLQLMPFLIGGAVYGLVTGTGAAVTFGEQLLWALLFGMLGILSFYMISSSIFALYIVTLPEVWPLQALQSARGLVQYRRWAVMRKILLLPILLVLIGMFIMVPVIIFLTPIAEAVFFVLSSAGFFVVHGYMYTLYRELLPSENG